ncbi:hypothetical protein GCM10007920_09170 [Ciceribacter naphthalenivorans]|uniref:Uncharacterized protein n=2 Tax=Alphaproteobacteria TaxID=28211 RepID=A0A512HEW4_9HYPH|nr:hypothetical protein RNA01_09230 [Ciceribacter naphthalenivorans]GLR21131.1 hypothetical protein GCM10007920_09170 [Ciceribacter naphthalenivorans]GLT03987.1 hypothetical protein GCM10007926_09170 [Sphingomonas psychrolutea]
MRPAPAKCRQPIKAFRISVAVPEAEDPPEQGLAAHDQKRLARIIQRKLHPQHKQRQKNSTKPVLRRLPRSPLDKRMQHLGDQSLERRLLVVKIVVGGPVIRSPQRMMSHTVTAP